MRKRVLHIIITVACIAATIETVRFSWLRITIDNAPEAFGITYPVFYPHLAGPVCHG